ncbi:prevent-host-death family protein [Quadrisphaera granulorum]|uniref:Antitoxin n=1 Tax=Quadrisphaera granulorum TaxID=317664 RepID=A0A316AWR2_9ACTN|nr:type II toxin-antitoxin system Phd/YefM family antitoxin [Quadrisphaera granulorum]PWJ54607.1 prevent-host-death family protein [Quadrisphaera granulorum]SZE95969.1 prevent-host-death family protein [Quadrisphaera granulorum]
MTTLPLAEVRAQLSKLVDSAVETHERIHITRNGRPAAVLLSAEDFESLLETLEILSDPEAMAEIKAYRENPDDVVPLAQVEAEMRAAGRLPS